MSNKEKILKIGTRGSPLALWQAREVEARLKAAHPDLGTEIVIIKTSGDWKPTDGEVRLSEAAGGKGQFATEIEAALSAGSVDIAVHSMKDMDSNLPDGLVIGHMLERADVRDALLLREGLRGSVRAVDDLPKDAVIGTASVRRAAAVLAKRPDLNIVPLRGNVGTRIEKVRAGKSGDGPIDATFLAAAGLNRLGLAHEIDVLIEPEEMLPAAGQGAVGIEMRVGDAGMGTMLSAISCDRTVMQVSAERAALKVLDGSCRAPIGAYAHFDGNEVHLRIQVSALDGQQSFEVDEQCVVKNAREAERFGQVLASALKVDIPSGILS